jgi:hypothetical protein
MTPSMPALIALALPWASQGKLETIRSAPITDKPVSDQVHWNKSLLFYSLYLIRFRPELRSAAQ